MQTNVALSNPRTALDYSLDRVRDRYAKKNKVMLGDAMLHERELKRYLYLCAMNPQERWPMVKTIDELWHTFIIFTRDYHAFCAILGRLYIHHEPNAGDEDRRETRETYQRFLECYRAEFGDPPATVWPAKLGDSECGGGDCESNCVQCR